MKATIWIHISDGCDGSAGVNFYRTQEEAELAAERDLQNCGQALCDNVICRELEFDEKGNLLNPDEIPELWH